MGITLIDNPPDLAAPRRSAGPVMTRDIVFGRGRLPSQRKTQVYDMATSSPVKDSRCSGLVD